MTQEEIERLEGGLMATVTLDRKERDVLRKGAIDLTAGGVTVGDHLAPLLDSDPKVLEARGVAEDTQLASALLNDLGWEKETDREEFKVTVPASQVEAVLVYLLHYHAQGIIDEIWHMGAGGSEADPRDAAERDQLAAMADEWRALDDLLSKVRGNRALLTPGHRAALDQAGGL